MGTHPIFESDFDCLTEMEDFAKARLEKDLAELKKLIDTHFAQRKKDEEELDVLKSQIDKRKDVRAKQIEERARKQQAKSRRRSQEEGSYGCYVYELFRFHGQETG